ncbi:MAG: phosphatase PAP2 family protein [Gorillibacterium sp.]|nr:phosphatase PAP2 family protein [Gorillibacterium sp.]
MQSTTAWLKKTELNLFRRINRKRLMAFRVFSPITHLGGPICTIGFTLIMIVMSTGSLQKVATISLIGLAISHIPVSIIKRTFPRIRPHQVLEEIETGENPLTDASFPSGHSTAIFSVLMPFVLYYPPIGLLLVPLAISVSVSRMVLGLHYPSDCLAGALLGTVTAVSMFILSN